MRVRRSSEEVEAERDLAVGAASSQLYEREVTDEERCRWQAEDAERDRKRIPLGFRS